MLTQQAIIDFCNKYDYDIRKSNNGRWIDQKCTADVVTIVSDCILNYNLEHENEFFTTFDIWHYKYTIENVEAIFKKPNVESVEAKSEYGKFFQQPMEMLANANVLIKEKKGNQNLYKINSLEILEYIAIRERNALIFLKEYIEKVLNDSEIGGIFDAFFEVQNKRMYENIKRRFSDFLIENTNINTETECNRIFTKVLNPLAYLKNTHGTEKGKISEQIITYDMLMYNRNNFRDIFIDKPKGITRKEYAKSRHIEVNDAYYHYQSTKAKRFLRLFNDSYRDGKTGHNDGIHTNDYATHMHHIFSESEYPEICYFLENIIALTPTQHLNYAHPNGRTQEINSQYQQLLLLSKADRIKENLLEEHQEKIYSFSNLLYVLKVGFENESILEISEMDFSSLINTINIYYGSII